MKKLLTYLIVFISAILTFPQELKEVYISIISDHSFMSLILCLIMVILILFGGFFLNAIVILPSEMLSMYLGDEEGREMLKPYNFFATGRALGLILTFSIISYFLNEPVLFWLLKKLGF